MTHSATVNDETKNERPTYTDAHDSHQSSNQSAPKADTAPKISESIDALYGWFTNSVEIFGYELKMAIDAVPGIILTNVAVVLMAAVTWVLCLVLSAYYLYSWLNSLGYALAGVFLLQLIANVGLAIYLHNLRKRIQFIKTRHEIRCLKSTIFGEA